jgi:hypothetical protein
MPNNTQKRFMLLIQYYNNFSHWMGVLKLKLIRPSQLDPSNRKLLAAAQQAGLSPEEIIRKSVEAA